MVPGGTQPDTLQQLGISYPELIHYFSKQHTATLVGSSLIACSVTQADLDSSLCFGTVNMGLYYYLVRTLLPPELNSADTPPRDDEIVYFWQSERRARWSVARMLFMLVTSCAHWVSDV